MNARELLAAATPRPWETDDVYVVGQVAGGRPGGEVIGDCIPSLRNLPVRAEQLVNAALIVAAVNEYEALLEVEQEVRALGPLAPSRLGFAIARLDEVRRG